MANTCCDSVYFYTKTNPERLNALREDLKASIALGPDTTQAWIANPLKRKGIPTDKLPLRGIVTYIEYNDDNILLDVDAAWTPLYETYQAIANTYQVEFVMQSTEPGCNIYINTDYSGQYFPDRYFISVEDEAFLTPAGTPIGDTLNHGTLFTTDTDLLKCFNKIGYVANTIGTLETLLKDTGIEIHRFKNTCNPE